MMPRTCIVTEQQSKIATPRRKEVEETNVDHIAEGIQRKKAKKDLVRIPNKGKGLDNGGRNSGTSDCNDGFNGMFFLTSKVPREMQIITALEALAKATAPETYEIAIDNVEIEK